MVWITHKSRFKLSVSMDLKYEEVFKTYFWAMRMNSIVPSAKRNTKWLFRFVLKFSLSNIVFLLLIYNIFFLNLRDRDFFMLCNNGTLSLIYLESLLLHGIVFCKEQCIESLLNNIKEDYALAKHLPVNEQEIIQHYAQRTVNVFKLWLFIVATGFLSFPLVNVVSITFFWIIGEFRLIPVYNFVYPSFIVDNMNNLCLFIFTYIVFFVFGTASTLMFIAFAPLGPALILHACSQLDVVKLRIQVLFKNDNIEEARKGLKEVVKQLQYIYDFVERLNLCFRFGLEVTCKGTTLLIPIACYEILESMKKGGFSFQFLTYIFGAAIINSTFCFYGDLLMEKGEDIRDAVYLCGWEKVHDREIRSTLRIILLRTQRPIAIRSMFRIVCLMFLTDLSSQTFTLFNLMHALWN